MKTAAPTTFPARLGRTLGRAWRGCARMDRRAKGWLLAQGWAPNVVKTVLLVVKLTVIGILFYTAFWLTVLLTVVAISGAWANSGKVAFTLLMIFCWELILDLCAFAGTI